MRTRALICALAALLICAVAASSAFARDDQDPGGGEGGGGGGGDAVLTPPQTSFTQQPEGLVTTKRPTIAYKSSLADSDYECRWAGSAGEAWSDTNKFLCGNTVGV